MGEIKFRVQLPSTGKFYYFNTLSRLFEHFTTDELRSIEIEGYDPSSIEASLAIVIKGTIVGYISLRKAFSALNKFELQGGAVMSLTKEETIARIEVQIELYRKEIKWKPSYILLQKIEGLEKVKTNFKEGRLSEEDLELLSIESLPH